MYNICPLKLQLKLRPSCNYPGLLIGCPQINTFHSNLLNEMACRCYTVIGVETYENNIFFDRLSYIDKMLYIHMNVILDT